MTNYGEKELLSDALGVEKAITAIYNTSANECSHPELRETLMNILNQEHDIQYDVFKCMHKRGFYPTPAAEDQKIATVKQTHSQSYKM